MEVMPSQDFAQVLRMMAARMDTAKDAPSIVERRGKASTNTQPNEKVERVPLKFPEPERVEEESEK